jgi:arylsulfatase A-like enzyme
LAHRKLDSNTLVIFSSDNGATFDIGGANTPFFNSNGVLRGTKGELFEGGVRVPMIARWPGHIAAAAVSDHISVQYDWMATFAELTQQTIPPADGISILPTLLGKNAAQQQHPFLYFEFPETGGQLAVRMGKWKGVKRNLRKNPSQPWMLFDLVRDPSEQEDLAERYPTIIREMDAIVKKEHQHPVLKEWELFPLHTTYH